MKKITIITPTYNRGYTLPKAYESLLRQTNKDFIWMIIDDGSTDNTEEIVKKWINDKKISIEYHKKENGGKHTAINYALDNAMSEYIIIALDSDDYFVDDALEIINNKLDNSKKGLVFLCDDENRSGKNIISYDIEKLKNCSISKAITTGIFNAGAIFVFETDYIKKYKFPVFNDEKFFNEGYILYQLDEPMVWIRDSLCIREFNEDGLTKNIFKTYIKNPNSWYLYNKLRYEKSISIKNRIKYKIYEITFGILSGNKVVKNSRNKLLTMLLYPIGLVGKMYIEKGGKKRE